MRDRGQAEGKGAEIVIYLLVCIFASIYLLSPSATDGMVVHIHILALTDRSPRFLTRQTSVVVEPRVVYTMVRDRFTK